MSICQEEQIRYASLYVYYNTQTEPNDAKQTHNKKPTEQKTN